MTTTTPADPPVSPAAGVRREVFIGGRWTTPAGNGLLDVTDPADATIVGAAPLCGVDDVDAAVTAARDAFPDWAARASSERLAAVARIREGLAARSEELAQLISAEMGAPMWLARATQVGAALAVLDQVPESFSAIRLSEPGANAVVVREPIGVVGCITPWNYPLFQIALKIGPALAAGCTVVVKPSEIAPLSAFVLAEVVEAAGLPPGVFNLVTGLGVPVGEALARHPEVDMVSFTGSTRAGSRVAELAAATVKRVALELGGKSPMILLEDADLSRAVPFGLDRCFNNSGQACVALSRMLVPRPLLARVEEEVLAGMSRFSVGHPRHSDARLGPLVSPEQHARVLRYLRTAEEEGARTVAGGLAEVSQGAGCYVPPTVLADVTPHMTVAREEIFGPVLSILVYDDMDEAVRIANDTPYGLSSAVWSEDRDTALAVAGRIRAGSVLINDAPMNLSTPFGGYKRSGLGREMGRYGLEEFFELKTIRLPQT